MTAKPARLVAQLAEAGGVEVTIAALGAYPQYLPFGATTRVHNVIYVAKYRKRIAEAGGVEAVIAALGAHPQTRTCRQKRATHSVSFPLLLENHFNLDFNARSIAEAVAWRLSFPLCALIPASVRRFENVTLAFCNS